MLFNEFTSYISVRGRKKKPTIIKARSFNFDIHFVVKTKSHRGKRKLEKLEKEKKKKTEKIK